MEANYSQGIVACSRRSGLFWTGKHELIRQTLAYYERNAEKYSNATVGAKLSDRYRLFLGG